jgi:phospholipid N-methyltransferase
VPSSRFLARALAAPLGCCDGHKPRQILEAGPGTGALTVEIVRQLQPEDHLTLCEINACFVKHLEDRLLNDPMLSPWKKQVSIHHGPVEDLNQPATFDHIISGLPFNNFPPDLVRQIFHSFFQTAKPGGTVSFFEYVGIRRLKAPFLESDERSRLDEVESILGEIMAHGERSLTLLNVPPAWSYCVHNGNAVAATTQKSPAAAD